MFGILNGDGWPTMTQRYFKARTGKPRHEVAGHAYIVPTADCSREG